MTLFLVLLDRVKIGSPEHLVPIAIAVIFGWCFIRFSKQKTTPSKKWRLIHIFAIFVSLIVFSYHINEILFGDYSFATDLPLYLCSLTALLIPIFTYNRKYWMFEILIFWIIAGTTQGVITPDIPEGFPTFDYFRYWIVHLGLLIIIFYAIFVFKMRPTLKSVFKSFFTLQGYVFLMLCINYVLNANYSYLSKKTESATVLDYFGEWPYYLMVVELMIIPLFLIIYLPFYLLKKSKPKMQTID